LEIHAFGTVHQTVHDTLTGVLPVGSFKDWELIYTVPNEEIFNMVVKAELACDVNQSDNVRNIPECVDLDDIEVVELLAPSGVYDTIGRVIRLEVKLKNNSPDKKYPQILLNAVISDGSFDTLFTEVINNFAEQETRNYRFNSSYIVPDTHQYMITVFVNRVDQYSDNDTIRETRTTDAALEPPVITTTSLPNGKVRTAYNEILAADGLGITWSIYLNNLPPDGLNLSPNGTISGTPTTEGYFPFNVMASNSYGNDIRLLFIFIEGDGVGISDIQNNSQLIYPNPTSGKVYLSTESYVKVYTIQGKLLMETFDKEVDLSQYAHGMYFLQVNERWVKVVKK
jgi:hypothetical protein